MKLGREKEELDLSGMVLTHHKLRKHGERALPLTDGDAPKLDPLNEVGSGSVREKQQAYLHEIIEQLNTLFGTDTTDGDQISYGETVGTKTLESTKLQQQAASNSKG